MIPVNVSPAAGGTQAGVAARINKNAAIGDAINEREPFRTRTTLCCFANSRATATRSSKTDLSARTQQTQHLAGCGVKMSAAASEPCKSLGHGDRQFKASASITTGVLRRCTTE